MSWWQDFRLYEGLRQHLARLPQPPAAPPVARQAAVLLPMYWQADEWHVLFTQRSQHVSSHKGQVSFPGGKPEAADASPVATALRETWEEIGLPATQVQVLGSLPPFLGGEQDFWLNAVVGVVPPDFTYRLSFGEVARVFSIPLAWLAHPAHAQHQPYKSRQLWFYQPYAGATLWGLTAQVVKNFIAHCQTMHAGMDALVQE